MTTTAAAGETTSNVEREVRAFVEETESQVYVPAQFLDRYVSVAMRRAIPKLLEGKWYADIPGFEGVWADGESPKECLDTLEEVLREWIVIKLADADRDLPVVDSIDLSVVLS